MIKIEWSNERLIRAMKMLLYFSAVLPQSFMNFYASNQELQEKIVFCNEPKLLKKPKSKNALKYMKAFNSDPQW